MKKINIILIIIFLLTLTIGSIAANKESLNYESKTETSEDIDIEFVNDSSVKEKISLILNNGDTIDLEYSQSRSEDNKIIKNTYIDSNGVEYVFDSETDKLVNIIDYESGSNEKYKSLTEDELIKISKEYLYKFFEVKDYEFVSFNKTSDGRRSLTFTKKINNISTRDIIHISFSASGYITSVVIPYQGYYDEVDNQLLSNTSITEKEMDSKISLYLDNLFIDETDELISYDYIDKMLYYDLNMKLYWDCFIELTLKDKNNSKFTTVLGLKLDTSSGKIMLDN